MSLDLQHDETAGKYYVLVDGQEAHVTYEKVSDRTFDLHHTFVPEELRGQSIAQEMVGKVLDDIKAKGNDFIPSCPFIEAYVEKHPQYREIVAR